ncbi:zinc ribbon domain-containing protein [Zoogloea sp.]|uniref:zinc ribbon domain-containing protein n=1 Tax=Zoogloea sp. TaxID=49181 RepID=UPI0025D31017|nr:zinc ribbon domain-containing protein [Zoogloea sp.]MCK6393927.1 zinc ribbon domain-containing protein [Zoogloea sp.]
MRLIQFLTRAAARTKQQLTHLDSQPLGRAVLVVVLLLDMFILMSIFDGLAAHTRQLTAPDEYIPHTCRALVIDQTWTADKRLGQLSALATAASTSPYPPREHRAEYHPLCAPYLEQITRIQADKALVRLFETHQKVEREVRDQQLAIDRLKGAYDTSLLERMAGDAPGQTAVDASRAEFRSRTAALDGLKAQAATLAQTINAHDDIQALWAALEKPSQADREQLRDELQRLNFWFPVKQLGMQLIFLLPLFLIFYAWNSASLRGGRGLQALVSAHLLVVSFIPILFKLVEAVYRIIPHRLLAALFEFLEAFRLVAIWHYLVMAAVIATALVVIHVLQKKLFSREQLLERRIARGECQGCGKHLPADSSACPFCGYAQFSPCPSCQGLMHRHARFCHHCGQPAAGDVGSGSS